MTKGIDDKYVRKEHVPIGRGNRQYIEKRNVHSRGFEIYTHEIYEEDVNYGNKAKKSFVKWYLKYCVSTDARVKYEINTKW